LYGPIEVPIESLIPISTDGLLAAEKNIGVSRRANGTTRLQGATLLTGQAAGVLAAIAVTHGVQPREVDPFEVQRALVADGDGLSITGLDDVAPTDPAWGAIQLAVTRGVMRESGVDAFAPAGPLARNLAAYSIATVFKLPFDPNPASSDFADVPVGDPYLPYVEALFHAGITGGCGGGNFCPTTSLTRFQLAAFVARGFAATLDPCTTSPFADVPSSDPMCPAIAFVTGAGLMVGCGGSNFCPATAVTRADTASALVATMIRNGAPP
jgi:FAD dependent oxidoreductase/S-layer homology domain